MEKIELCTELWFHVLSYLDPEDRYIFKQVSKEAYDISLGFFSSISKKRITKDNKETLSEVISKTNKSIFPRKRYCDYLVKNNYNSLLLFALNRNFKFSETTYIAAASGNNLEAFKIIRDFCRSHIMWLPRYLSTKFTTQCAIEAAKHGNIKMLRYLWENKCPFNEDVMNAAVRQKNINAVFWLIEQGVPCNQGNKGTIYKALKANRVEIASYLINKGINPCIHSLKEATRLGKLKLLKRIQSKLETRHDLLMSLGLSVIKTKTTKTIAIAAARYNQKHIIKCLERRCEYSIDNCLTKGYTIAGVLNEKVKETTMVNKTIRTALKYPHLNILKYFNERGHRITFHEVFVEYKARKDSRERLYKVLDWLSCHEEITPTFYSYLLDGIILRRQRNGKQSVFDLFSWLQEKGIEPEPLSLNNLVSLGLIDCIKLLHERGKLDDYVDNSLIVSALRSLDEETIKFFITFYGEKVRECDEELTRIMKYAAKSGKHELFKILYNFKGCEDIVECIKNLSRMSFNKTTILDLYTGNEGRCFFWYLVNGIPFVPLGEEY